MIRKTIISIGEYAIYYCLAWAWFGIFGVNNVIIAGISGSFLFAFVLVFWSNRSDILGHQTTLNWFDYWFLCPNNSIDFTITELITDWFFGYPHDYAFEGKKLICVKCGFRGLYIKNGLYDRSLTNKEVEK